MDKLGVRIKKIKNTLLVGFFKNQSKSNIFTKEIPVNFTGNSFVNFTGISFVKLTSISIKWDFPYTWSEFWKNVFFWFWQKFRGISLWKNFVKGFPFFVARYLTISLRGPVLQTLRRAQASLMGRVGRVGRKSKGSFIFFSF